MLFEVLGDIWVVERNPYLQDDLLDNPRRRQCWSRRCAIADARSRSARASERARIPSATARSRAGRRRRAAVDRFAVSFSRHAGLRKRARAARALHATDNIAFDGLARVSHVTDATDWRVEYPFVVLYPDPKTKCAAGRGLHRARPHDRAARRRNGLHGRRDSARRALGGDQYGEAGTDERRRARVLPGHTTATLTIDCGAGVVTRRAMDAADAAGLVFACDPTSADASCIGGNVAVNAGGKKAGAVGHGARQPRVVADGHARRAVARSHSARPQPRQDPRRAAGDVRAARGSRGRQDVSRRRR
jgi:hypothetical protein